MGRKPTSAVAVTCIGGLLAGCGSVWHPMGLGFTAIRSGEDLQTQWVSLATRYSGDGDALAADLARRGATCTVRPAAAGKVANIQCAYFFCKGTWPQQLSWNIPQKYTAQSRNAAVVSSGYEPGAAVYVDYTLATHGQCRDRGKLKESQRMFVLGEGGKSSGGKVTVN
jgi:hypothetical protein